MSNVQKFKVGDVVTTSFSGKVTTHKITKVERGICESGWLYDVTPAIKGGGKEGFDQNWFDLAEGAGNA